MHSYELDGSAISGSAIPLLFYYKLHRQLQIFFSFIPLCLIAGQYIMTYVQRYLPLRQITNIFFKFQNISVKYLEKFFHSQLKTDALNTAIRD
jgi:hypothetical protein